MEYFQGAGPDAKQVLERVLKCTPGDIIDRTDLTDIMDELNQYARHTATAPPIRLALQAKQNFVVAFETEFDFELARMQLAQKSRTIKSVRGLEWLFKNGYDYFSVSGYAACVWLVAINMLRDLGDDLAIFDAVFTDEYYTRLPCLLRLTKGERCLILGSLELKLQGLEHLLDGHLTARFSCLL